MPWFGHGNARAKTPEATSVLRSLIVLDGVPYPPIGGQQLRYRQTIEALSRLGEVQLLCFGRPGSQIHQRPGQPTSVWLNPKPPKSVLHACTGLVAPRLKERLRSAQRQTFLDQLRVRAARAIGTAAPDLVVVASAGLAVYLPPLDGLGVPVVYDAHNVERALWRDLTHLQGELGDNNFNARFRDRILAGEAALVEGAAQLWACSPSDADLFAATYGPMRPDVRVVPNTVDVASFASVARPLAQDASDRAPSLLFTGNFGYPPNLESAFCLSGEVLPLVRQSAPRCRLVFCGRNPPAALLDLVAGDPGITVTGEIPDVRPWLASCDVVVVPLRHGGGTRLKILEALAAACPVVSTVKGAEGLDIEHGRDLLLAETPDAISDAVLWCLANRISAAEMAARGRALVAARYSWEANFLTVRAAIDRLSPTTTSMPAVRSADTDAAARALGRGEGPIARG
ncbi:MAG: glycosyltransferase family 4 protein [Geminicoccaceae bacterium]